MNNELICEIQEQIKNWYDKYGKFASFHEAMSVLREEFEELWEQCKQKKLNYASIQSEVLDCIVVLFKMYQDVTIDKCDRYRTEKTSADEFDCI